MSTASTDLGWASRSRPMLGMLGKPRRVSAAPASLAHRAGQGVF